MRSTRCVVLGGLLTILTILASTATPVLAGFTDFDLFVPMAGRNAGVYPSDWYTTAWIHNPGPDAAVARIYFLERGTANLDPPSRDVMIAAGATERIDNIIETLFHRQAFGALRVTCATQKLAVTSRTYSKGPAEGERDSVGQDFAGVPASFAIGAGERAQVLGVHQTLPAGDSDSRFNFGLVETTGHPVTVRVTAYDGSDTSLGHTDLQVRELSQRQVAFKDRFPGLSTDNARLEIEVLSGAGKVIAYGSGISNGTQDPTTFEMEYPARVLAETGASAVTGVVAGQGLTGGGDSGVVTLHVGAGNGVAVDADTVGIAQGGVSTAELADGAVTTAKLSAAGSVAGQGLISTGGGVAWGTVAGPQGPAGPAGPQGPPGLAGTVQAPGFLRSSVDPSTPNGSFPSVAIGRDALGLISYIGGGETAQLRVAHCSQVECSSATISAVDIGSGVRARSSIAIGSDGLGLITYHVCEGEGCAGPVLSTTDQAPGPSRSGVASSRGKGPMLVGHGAQDARGLKVAHCADVVCSSATTSTVETGLATDFSSIAIGSDGLALISYYDATNKDLKVAHCSDVPCSAATLSTLDSTGDVGWDTSLTIGADGLGLISYIDWTNADLKVAHCDDVACSSATTTAIYNSSTLVHSSSIGLGSDGLGLIAYRDSDANGVMVAHCTDLACSSATTSLIGGTAYGGWTLALTIGSDGRGIVSYYDAIGPSLKTAHCSDAICSVATTVQVDADAEVGHGTAVAIGTDGMPLVAYRGSPGQLRVAHCSNTLCVPYFRRR